MSPLAAPNGWFVKANLAAAAEFVGGLTVLTAVKFPKVNPATVGTGVGSVAPDVAVTPAKS